MVVSRDRPSPLPSDSKSRNYVIRAGPLQEMLKTKTFAAAIIVHIPCFPNFIPLPFDSI